MSLGSDDERRVGNDRLEVDRGIQRGEHRTNLFGSNARTAPVLRQRFKFVPGTRASFPPVLQRQKRRKPRNGYEPTAIPRGAAHRGATEREPAHLP